MHDVFVSHVEEDRELALDLADRLQQAGVSTWCYERDQVAGPSYLERTGTAVSECRAFLLLISSHSLGSNQVTQELVRAHEERKPILPVLVDVPHVKFQTRRPDWRQAVGAATSVSVAEQGVSGVVDSLLRGLETFGIAADPSAATAPQQTQSPPPTRRPKQGWTPPRNRKRAAKRGHRWGVIAVIAIAVIAAAAVAGVWAVSRSPESLSAIRVVVKMVNPGRSAVSLRKSDNFYLTKLRGSGNVDVMLPQKYTLAPHEGLGTPAGLMEIKPGENVLIAEIPISYLRTLKTGEWDIFMSFTRADGTSFNSESMPFTEEALAKNSLPANTSSERPIKQAAPPILPKVSMKYWAWEPDNSPKTPAWRHVAPPTDVEKYFYLAGFAGDQKAASFDKTWRADFHSPPKSMRFSFSTKEPQSYGWAGNLWVDVMYPKYSRGIDLSKVEKLAFWAKGEKGGEQVEFRVGGTVAQDKQPAFSTGVVVLSREWRELSITFDDRSNLDWVFAGFMWLATGQDNPNGCSFLLDDLHFE